MIKQAVWRSWIERLRKAIGCPIKWDFKYRPDRQIEMHLLWSEIAANYQTHNEMSYYTQIEAALTLTESVLCVIEVNARSWYRCAAHHYVDVVGCLHNFSYVTPAQQEKHYSSRGESDVQVIADTRNDDAKFFSSITHQTLSYYLDEILVIAWKHIIYTRPGHIYYKDRGWIGGSKGKPADHIRFDFDYSSFEVHGHPILENEKPEGEKWIQEIVNDKDEEIDEMAFPTIDEMWDVPLRDDIES